MIDPPSISTSHGKLEILLDGAPLLWFETIYLRSIEDRNSTYQIFSFVLFSAAF